MSLGSLASGGPRPRRTLSFNALGLGAVSSQSVVLSRGSVSSELVISTYGRVRRK